LPSAEPSWGSILDLAATKFHPVSGSARILFPVSFSTFLPQGAGDRVTGQAAIPAEYPKHLVPLGGHAFIYAWYVCVFKAMTDEDSPRVAALLESARTVTILMFSKYDDKLLAQESIRLSEAIRASAQVSVDNFPVFCEKVERCVGSVGGQVLRAWNLPREHRFNLAVWAADPNLLALAGRRFAPHPHRPSKSALASK